MKITFPLRPVLLAALLSTAGLLTVAQADVVLPSIFGDHMVLQQSAKIPVWGWAAAGEQVTVTLGTESASATADTAGNWRADLDPVPATATPQTLTVKGNNTVTFQDVVVGDVWVASGQSNMQFGIGADDGGTLAIAEAHEPQIRLFVVRANTALEPQVELKTTPPNPRAGSWQVCTPESLKASGFSAVGYYFARDIHHNTHRPIGMIGTYVGGTPAQAWTSVAALQKVPSLAHYAEAHQKIMDGLAQAQASYARKQAAFQAALDKWNQEVYPAYKAASDQWQSASTAAQASGQPAPPWPKPAQPRPLPPVPPDGGTYSAGNLFNGMVAPLIPYAIKGVIWYQGESNAGGHDYGALFPCLIADWRERWGQGDFPFLFVQLPNYQTAQSKPSEGGWAWLREAQLHALSLPNTGMAITIDLGEVSNIHPADKVDVGHRLALVARHVAYGENLVYSGPLYDSMQVEGRKVRLTFKEVGSGLQLGHPPLPPTELSGFAIAGSDHNWSWADAVIEGNTVVVSSDQVPAPVAVRYGWANNPPCDLYNKENLPASPFRTDDWEPAPGE